MTDTSTFPRMAERKAIAEWAAAVRARAADEAREIAEAEAPILPERDAMQARHAAESAAMELRHHREMEEVRQRLREAIEPVLSRYSAMPPVGAPTALDDVLGIDEDIDPARCARSGVVLLADDELVEDPETGERFLRAALGLPARTPKPPRAFEEHP